MISDSYFRICYELFDSHLLTINRRLFFTVPMKFTQILYMYMYEFRRCISVDLVPVCVPFTF